MFIARKYRQNNVVEYVLYMWHIEELIRSLNFDLSEIEANVIAPFGLNETAGAKLRNWYADLIDRMTEERLRETGHLEELREMMAELHYLHHSLLTLYQDSHYIELAHKAMPAIEDLRARSNSKFVTDIDLAMNGLFGVLVLKLKKRQVSPATQEAVSQISQMMGHLAVQFKKMKAGELTLPKILEN